jgi:capsular exopolysaccharide synthesis family protein
MAEKKTIESSEKIMQSLWYKFFPFWPLFLFCIFFFLLIGFTYTLYKKPNFVVAATLIITNENNNNKAYGNQPFQALNAFATTQVVDNEVLILQSRTLMKDVATTLRLYAPVWEKRGVSSFSAYLTSPVIVEAKNPEMLKKTVRVSFEFDANSNTITVDNKQYGLNQWIEFPFGTLRFLKNSNQKQKTTNPLFFSLEHPTIVAENLIGNLTVASVSKLSTTINLTYKTDVPDLGEAILNELLRQYGRSAIENENALAASTLVFIGDRLRDVERELDSIERRVQEFRTRTGAIDLSEQGRIYLQNVAETDRRVAEIDAQLAVLNQVSRYVNQEGRLTGVIPTNLGIDDPVLAELLQQLNELELQLTNQRTTTGQNNPVVRSIENEIQKIRPNIRNIVTNQQERLRASRNNLTATTGRINTTIRGIPGQERELLEISRQQAVKRDLYAFLLQRREEAALSSSSSIADNRVVDWADAKIATQSSGRMIVLLGCVFAAIGFSIAYVIFKESFTNKVLFRAEVEKFTALPIISEVSYHKQRRQPRATSLASAISAKEFSQLLAALGLFNSTGSKKTIMVTSQLLNEGTSFVSRNLARHLAATGKKVALLDFDLLKPDTSALFGMEQANGFTDYFYSTQDLSLLLHSSTYPNLDIMPAGSKTGSHIPILMSPKLEMLFTGLRTLYDFVIVDTPPLELASDAFALARFSEVTLLVVRLGVTPKTVLKQLDTNVQLKTMNNMNIVLNGITARGFPKRYFGYGYGYGHEMVPRKQLLRLSQNAPKSKVSWI